MEAEFCEHSDSAWECAVGKETQLSGMSHRQGSAALIQARRVASGLSLPRLAALTRLARQRLSFIETNRRVPAIDQREDADLASMGAVQDALNGLAGDEACGDDCELFEQMGRKRTSEYASGLTEKK
jgi:hypothetical protein